MYFEQNLVVRIFIKKLEVAFSQKYMLKIDNSLSTVEFAILIQLHINHN